MKILEIDRIFIDNIDKLKQNFYKSFELYLENFISDKDMWEEHIYLNPKSFTYEKLWKTKKGKLLIEEDIDINYFQDFLDYICNEVGREWEISDSGDYYILKYDVELETEEEIIEQIVRLIKSGVIKNLDKIRTTILREIF